MVGRESEKVCASVCGGGGESSITEVQTQGSYAWITEMSLIY